MRLNILSLVGLLLLVAGVAFLLGLGIPGRETLFEVGDVSASIDTERSVSPIISGMLALVGIVAIAVGQTAGRSS